MSSNPLRRAVGEPETEVEEISVSEIEPQHFDLSVPSGSGPQNLRFTQELPGIERAIYADLRRSQGPTLRSSFSSTVSLSAIRTLIENLLGTALEQQQTERIQKLFQYQADLDLLTHRLAAQSLKRSTNGAPFDPSKVLLTNSLRASADSFAPPTAASSETSGSSVVSSSNTATVPCPICFDDFPAESMVNVHSCKIHVYCVQCLAGHAEALISTAEVARLYCPAPDCKQPFEEADIKSLVPPEVYDRYLQFLVLEHLKDAAHIWCPSCSAPILSSDVTCPSPTSLVICPSCNAYICSSCSKPYHPSSMCDGSTIDDPDLLAYLHEQGLKVKECPKCFRYVQKNGGCNHITCGCKTNWCWICGDFIDPEWRHYNEGLCRGLQFANVDSVIEHLKNTFMVDLKNRKENETKTLKQAQRQERADFLRANQPSLTIPGPNGTTKKRRTPEQIQEIQAMFARQKAAWEPLNQKYSPETTQSELERSVKNAQEDLDLRRAARRERFIALRNTPTSSSTPQE